MNRTPTVPGGRPDEGSASAPEGDTSPPARSRARELGALAPWVLVVALTAVAAIAGVGWWQAGTDDAARDEIEAVSGRAVSTLTTWDASDLGPVQQAVAEFGTERFQQEADEIFGEFATGLEQARVTSEGEVLELAVAEVADDRAVALATVQQQVTNTSTDEAAVSSCWGARVTLARIDGTWLVDHLALFGPNACDDAAGTGS